MLPRLHCNRVSLMRQVIYTVDIAFNSFLVPAVNRCNSLRKLTVVTLVGKKHVSTQQSRNSLAIAYLEQATFDDQLSLDEHHIPDIHISPLLHRYLECGIG